MTPARSSSGPRPHANFWALGARGLGLLALAAVAAVPAAPALAAVPPCPPGTALAVKLTATDEASGNRLIATHDIDVAYKFDKTVAGGPSVNLDSLTASTRRSSPRLDNAYSFLAARPGPQVFTLFWLQDTTTADFNVATCAASASRTFTVRPARAVHAGPPKIVYDRYTGAGEDEVLSIPVVAPVDADFSPIAVSLRSIKGSRIPVGGRPSTFRFRIKDEETSAYFGRFRVRVTPPARGPWGTHRMTLAVNGFPGRLVAVSVELRQGGRRISRVGVRLACGSAGTAFDCNTLRAFRF